MKTVLLNLTLIVLLISLVSCNSINGNEEKKEAITSKTENIEVYYFHYTRRCATCTAVENVTKETIEELYVTQVEAGRVVFKTINLDEPESEEIAAKLEVSSQTLLIVAGDKKENMTTDAFMNAKSNPEKLREIIKSTIDPFIEK